MTKEFLPRGAPAAMTSRSQVYERDPCPIRVLGDVGGGFSLGVGGGIIWHGIKGAYKAPRGEKLMNAVLTIARRAPRTGAAFAAWGGGFSIVDCSLQAIRRKEDIWNPIMAGGIVGATLPMRRGRRAMMWGAVAGVVILAAIEGVSLYFQKSSAVDQAALPPVGLPPGATARV